MNSQRHSAAFTMVEMLTVIAIIAIVASLVGPTVGHFRKGDTMLSASRQMLDSVARARQLAISQRTTVYMVFVPIDYWLDPPSGYWSSSDSIAATNLADKQLTGYNYLSLRTVGDQPGRGFPRYLASWQTLPDSSFIDQDKFTISRGQYLTNLYLKSGLYVSGFDWSTNLPFPLAETQGYAGAQPPGGPYPRLPYIAFDYLGRLVSGHDEFIPLAHGSVTPSTDANKKPVLTAAAFVRETPPGNSVDSYNVIHIDWLTGRARLERQEIK